MRTLTKNISFLLFFILLIQVLDVQAQRFPKPEFESGYVQESVQTPVPRSDFMEYFDLFVLFAALSVVSYLVIKKRSRRGVFWISIFSVLYFGFFREGCVCSVGSVQNIALALFDSTYTIPLTVIGFFVLPLIFALLFGRTFCAGVCPLGAIQDIFVLKPMSLPKWVNSLLGMIPYLYLGLAILFAATGSDFIICRYDPFIGIFRFDATFSMFLLAAIFLLAGIYIARPYCRFFCPYGVLLNWMSQFSRKHMTITPTECIQCPLCENSCPFDAIDQPTDKKSNISTPAGVRRLKILFVLLPVFVFVGGWIGYQLHETFAKVNNKVSLAHELFHEKDNASEVESLEIETFKSKGQVEEELYQEALSIIEDFKTGSMILGGFIGLVFGITLISLSRKKYRTDYEPNRGNCFSCARCMDYCPVKKVE